MHGSAVLWVECAADGAILRGSDDALALLGSLTPALGSFAPHIARRPDLEAAFRRHEGRVRLGLRAGRELVPCDVEVGEGSRGSVHLTLAPVPLSQEAGVAAALQDWAMACRDGVVLCDADGHLLFANPAFCEMTGLQDAELFGRDLLALSEAADGEDERMRRALFVSGSYRGDRSLKRAIGRALAVEVSITAFGGPPTRHLLVLCRDVGELRESEALALAEARTATTARLAAGLAHDINNLAAEVVAWAEEALPLEDPVDLRLALTREVALGESAGHIGQQLARLAGAGGQERPADLGLVLGDVAWLLERASSLTAAVEVVLPPETTLLDTDGEELRALLLLLAVRLLSEGGSALALQGHADEHTAGVLLRCVAPRDARERLGRLFPGQGMRSSLGNALAVRASRAGLGLALELDEAGIALRFSAARVGAVGRAAAPAAPVQRRGFGRALVAEDNEQLRGLMVRALEMLFPEVLSAPDGAEALRLLEGVRGEVDLVVTDVMMPSVDGRELMERARALAPGLPCVYTSGQTNAVGVEGPRDRFLRKPFKLAALRTAVEQLLGEAVHP